jgi:hypothetical protein
VELADLLPAVPTDFFDLSRATLEVIRKTTISSQHASEWLDDDGENLRLKLGNHEAPLIKLFPSETSVPVIGIDTTNIDIGQTQKGILCAVRGTIVKAKNGRYEYTRYGPLPFHITNENRQILYDNVVESFFGSQEYGAAPPLDKMSEVIRGLLERWLQHQVATSNSDTIILWDGSLAAPRVSRSLPLVRMILGEARNNSNSVLAFSKKTSLPLWSDSLDLVDSRLAPGLLDVDEEARASAMGQLIFLGHVYAAKFSPGIYTFRVDIDRSISSNTAEIGGKLLASECLHENYPETLRLAHVLSKFSSVEIVGIHRFIGKTYGFKASPGPNIRRTIFGPLEGNVPPEGVLGY